MAELVLVSLGVVIGGGTAAILALYLYLSRPARQARNTAVIALGYFLFGGSALGAILLLLRICDQSGVGRQSSEHYVILYSYAAGLAIGVFLAVRAEFKWRKSPGSSGGVTK